jgi:hypothetical protein
VVCCFGLALWRQQESAEFAARRRALAHLGLCGLLAARVALAAFGLRVGYFGGCGAGVQGDILRTAEIPQVAAG